MLLLNLDAHAEVTVRVCAADDSGDQSDRPFELYRLQPGPRGLSDHTIALNGRVLELGDGGEVPPLPPVNGSGSLTLAPLDIAFVVLGDMHCPST